MMYNDVVYLGISAMLDIYQEIIRIQTEGGEAALATIVSTKGSTPRETGAKMLVKGDGTTVGSIGGGNAESKVCREAKQVIMDGKPKILHLDLTGRGPIDMVCGGIMDVFIEPIESRPTLYIFGSGHISFPLVDVGKVAGFKVVVVDDRPEFASRERLPDANQVLCDQFESAFLTLKIGPSGYIVIATQTHQSDERVLELALSTPANYVGLLASRKKKETIFSRLKAKGTPQELLDKVHSPIGLEIRAETPEEIAISILAEIIKVRRSSA